MLISGRGVLLSEAPLFLCPMIKFVIVMTI
mgnify:CR=1 FL=1